MRSFGRRADYVFKFSEGEPGVTAILLAESPEYAELIVIAAACFHEEAGPIQLRMDLAMSIGNACSLLVTQALGSGAGFDQFVPMPLLREIIMPPRFRLAASTPAALVGRLRGAVIYRVRYIEQLS